MWTTCTLTGQEVTGEDRDLRKSFAALDRIARQEATLGKLDETASMPASPSRTRRRSKPR